MAEDDALVVISTHLRPEEAGMLRGLLESAGIPVVVRDDNLAGINPFLLPAIGGAKLAVARSDAERAAEIVESAGVFPGAGPGEPVDIPDDEWSRAAEPEARREEAPATGRAGRMALAVAGVLLALWLLQRWVR